MSSRFGGRLAAVLVGVVIVASCTGSADNNGGLAPDPTGSLQPDASTRITDATAAAGAVLSVPEQFSSIQEAVDAARPGDLVLISPGVYHEAVNVVTELITIRGLDRNEVILDGRFELDNGIRVLGAAGVAIENMTVKNYTTNGVFWTDADGYRGSYLTAHRNGNYGVYAFDSVNGLLEHSYASGSRDAGFYIGQCFECNAVMDDVVSEFNGLGYSGTNAGGDLYIVNSRFNNNRAGIDVNSGSYELCYPQRRATIVGNLVYDNNQPDTPAVGDALYAMGNGIIILGGIGNVIERNRVVDHDRTGIGLVAFPEFRPNDAMPEEDTWDLSCAESRQLPLADGAALGSIYWPPIDNRVVGNAVDESGVADLAVAVIDADGTVIDPTTLGNCFSGNVFSTSAPVDIEVLFPCDGAGSGGDWTIGGIDVSGWVSAYTQDQPQIDYETAPTPSSPLLDGMEDPASAPPSPAVDLPPKIDVAAITIPDAP